MDDVRVRVRRKVAKQLYTDVYEPSVETVDDEAEKKKRGPTPVVRESPYTVQNFCWILLAIAVFYHTEFLPTVLNDTRIQRTWFYVGLVLIAVNLSIALFLILYLSIVKKVHSDLWERHYPNAIPIATACFACGSFCVTLGLWPIWGYFTPLIFFSLFMGVVITIAMLPNF